MTTCNYKELSALGDERFDCAFEPYQIPDFVLETIPIGYRADITGALWELVDGELGEVWLSDSFQPYRMTATYFPPCFWHEEMADSAETAQ